MSNPTAVQVGSSPRMRGAQVRSIVGLGSHGIIPADAGSTTSAPSAAWTSADHPRGCGEHSGTSISCEVHRGSSPRMRGAPKKIHIHSRLERIIPADAGSTCSMTWVTLSMPDHPRGCGEHHAAAVSGVIVRGSSPRMRGARDFDAGGLVVLRIIPADAGSTRPGVRPNI